MNKRLTAVFSLIILVSMVLSACTAATTQAPTPTAVPTQPAAPVATNTVAPVATKAPATAVPTVAPTATAVPQVGGWLDSMVFTKVADAPSAVAQLQAGAIDLYGYTATNQEAFKTVKADKNLTYFNAFGAYKQLILNSATCTDKNVLNPFSDMAIREAMNWAIDRNYIAQEIQGGLALPKFTILNGAFPDAARYAAELAAIATKYAYNLDAAQKVVDAEMPKLGATKDAAGKWQFKGKPVTIIGIIRSEDARKQIGDYFATQLEKLGFTLDRQVKTSKEASPIWTGDVLLCKFNYYTAGWVSTAISRDQGFDIEGFNAGTGYGYPVMLGKPSKELDAADKALYTNNFKTMDERAKLFQTALDLSMKESWWGAMVIDDISYLPMRNNVTFASDLAAGGGNNIFPYTVRFTDKVGGTMRIANSGILTDPWNPVQGSNWVFDALPKSATEDVAFIYDPFTGLRVPKLAVKSDVVVQTGLPVAQSATSSSWLTLKFQDTIAVPDDAWADWDAVKQVFISAKDRATAAKAGDPKGPDAGYTQTAKVMTTITYTPDLFKTKWHDGSTFSVADVVMGMIMSFEPGKEKDKIFDQTFTDSFLTPLMSHLKGFKIVSTNPLTITTWDDSVALDAENVGLSWYPTERDSYAYGTAAWHNMSPAVMAEADGKIAFSQTKATDKKVEWTNFASGPTLATQAEYLDKVAATGDLPYAPTLSQYVKVDEAKARYANLQAWYKAHNNLWIGTGPYFLDKIDTTAGSVTVTKFKDYMFSLESWSKYGKAPVAVLKVDGPAQVAAATEAVFNLDVSFDGKPYASKDIANVAYTLFGSDGSVVDKGSAKLTAEGKYTITLSTDVTTKLPAGAAKLSIAAVSNLVALPTFATAEFVVVK